MDGVNFIDLNQKDKKKQMQINKLSRNKKATVLGDYVGYIGRLEGTDNNGEHSLFGTLCNDDEVWNMQKKEIIDYFKDKVIDGRYIYKVVLSVTQEDAEKYGVTTKDEWENLIRSNIRVISNEYNINFENLDWIASFHTEDGHPHIHLVLWDKEKNRTSVPYINYDKIKQKLNYSIYKRDIQPYLDEKNKIKKDIRAIFQDNIDEVILCDRIKLFNNKVSKNDLNEIAIKLKELYEIKENENSSSWKMQYQSVEVKRILRETTNKIVDSTTQIKNEIDKYVNACVKIEEIRNINCNFKSSNKKIKQTIDIETEFILKKIDNQILNYLKEAKIELNKNNQQKHYKITNKKISKLLINIYNDLVNVNYMNNYFLNKNVNLPKNKMEKREWAIKHRDIGLIDWEK